MLRPVNFRSARSDFIENAERVSERAEARCAERPASLKGRGPTPGKGDMKKRQKLSSGPIKIFRCQMTSLQDLMQEGRKKKVARRVQGGQKSGPKTVRESLEKTIPRYMPSRHWGEMAGWYRVTW